MKEQDKFKITVDRLITTLRHAFSEVEGGIRGYFMCQAGGQPPLDAPTAYCPILYLGEPSPGSPRILLNELKAEDARQLLAFFEGQLREQAINALDTLDGVVKTLRAAMVDGCVTAEEEPPVVNDELRELEEAIELDADIDDVT